MKTVFRALVFSAFVGLTGCTASDGTADNPFTRRFAWFSYLNGDDIRAVCQAGAPDRYRLVLNAVYTEQVRIYDVSSSTDGGAMVEARVLGGYVGSINLLDPLAGVSGKTSLTRVDAEEWKGLQAAFMRDGLDETLMPLTSLYSPGFYWLGVGCRSGKVVFHAWEGDTKEGFSKLSFPDILFAADRTGIAVNKWRRIYDASRIATDPRGVVAEGPQFVIQVRGNGLR